MTQIICNAQEADGADTFIGRRRPELFRRAGLAWIGVEANRETLMMPHLLFLAWGRKPALGLPGHERR